MKEIVAVIEEPLVPVEEIPVQVRLLYTWGELFNLMVIVFFLIPIWGFPIVIISSALGLGPFVPGLSLLVYVVVAIWAMLERTRRKITAWLRFERGGFFIKTQREWIGMVPKVMEWKAGETFLLKGSGRKVEISLPTRDDAARAGLKIKASFSRNRRNLSDCRYFSDGRNEEETGSFLKAESS